MRNNERTGRDCRRRIVWLALLAVLLSFPVSVPAQEESAASGEIPLTKDGTPSETLLSLNFKNTDMREVLNIIAYKSGVNIIAGDDVEAQVSMQLTDVTWERALDVILKTYNFTYKREKNLIRVMSLSRAKEEENKVPVVTKILALNFAAVSDVKNSLQKILSPRGNIEIDERTNSLIVTDIPEVVMQVEDAAQALDSRTPQVLIEAMMVDVKLSDEDRMGVGWLLGNRNTLDATSGQYKDGYSATTDLTTAGQKSLSKISFTPVFNEFDLFTTIEAWQSSRKAEILANPKVMTLDNQEAKIEILEEVPYIETVLDPSGSGTKDTVSFKEAGIKLSVTPHITSGGFISMSVKPEQSFQSGTILNQPILETRRAETNLLVRNGQTIVIGGLRKRDEQLTHEQVPVLGNLPILGSLFRRKVVQETESELLIFVTPKVVYEPEMKTGEKDWFEKLDNTARLSFDNRPEMEKWHEWWAARQHALSTAVQQAEQKQNTAAGSVAAVSVPSPETPRPSRPVSKFRRRRQPQPPAVVAPAAGARSNESVRESDVQISVDPVEENARRLLRELEEDNQQFQSDLSTM